MIRRRPLENRSRGQALVEFALVLPMFVLVIFGLLDLGRVVYMNNALSEAARDGARWGVVQGRSADTAGRSSVAVETTQRMTAIPNPAVSVTCQRDSVTVSSCRTNDILVVQTAVTVELITPVLSALIGPLDLSATSRVTVQQ